ncbi:MAG TPA: hypothetical protein PLR87_07215 [Thermoanaerobaculaceae bacterium]|nr:hypothetical protein [Thermoanaerobaculaceae bacterium]
MGARVCNTTSSAIDDISVAMVWGNSDDEYIVNRPGSLTTLSFATLGAGACVDAYFEIELINRSRTSFGKFRPYSIVASAPGVSPAATPAGRQILIESLVSQNRNTTDQIRHCDPAAGGTGYCDPSTGTGWVVLGAGGTVSFAVGNSYYIELTSQTATAYEELQSFLTLSNTIFQVLSVSTTYSTRTAPEERVPNPNPRLWGDGCLWDSDPASPNYNSCLSAGKVGGVVKTLYFIRIISGGGETVTLEALHYDRSGGSFHYNTDYSQSPGDATFFDPLDATFSKRFVPATIAAHNPPTVTSRSTLTFTITNPNPLTVSPYSFTDSLPVLGSSQMRVADPPNAQTLGCGTPTFAPAANDTSLSFSDGTIAANGTCTVRVDVTVPLVVDATYPFTLNNVSDNLFVGGSDTGKYAAAALEVTAAPAPPQTCTQYPTPTTLAEWTSFSIATNPPPTYVIKTGIASAENGSGLTFSVGNSEWRAEAKTANQTLDAARLTSSYYQFTVDTTGMQSIDFALEVFRQNANAPAAITLDYGPPGDLVQSGTLNPVPTQPNRPNALNFSVTALTNLNPSGPTLFRVYAYSASGTNQPIRMVVARIQGVGEICEPVEPQAEPDPPTLTKQFSPATVRVGEPSTITFAIANPNPLDALTHVTFRDELPAGMTAVSGTFANSGCGGTWGLESGNPSVLLLSDGSLAARQTSPPDPPNPSSVCTLSVDVVSTTIGDNLNITDPIDARETLPGNSASATLAVLPPPLAPTIHKVFDPNPLLDPAGTSTLTFRITNNDPSLAIVSVAFTDTLPTAGGVQMVAATPFSYSHNGKCGAAHSFTWNGTSFTLSFSGGAIGAGEVCELSTSVAVPGLTPPEGGVLYANQTSIVSHVFNGTTYLGNAAKATLLVDRPIPAIALEKLVGLTNDPDGAWYKYLVVTPGTQLYYKLTVENTGEVALSNVTLEDPPGTVICGPSTVLPVASATNNDHIKTCIVGPVTAQEGTFPNTATATGTYSGTPYTASSSATYKGETPTAVVMGRVELAVVEVGEFLRGVGAQDLDCDGLLRLLRAWDRVAAAGMERASREELLAALGAYLDPDRDGQVVVFRWETLAEQGTIGFYAERLGVGGWGRINAEMLPGLIASPMGAEYWLADPGARPGDGYRYRLIEVEARGTTREYGPFDLQVGSGGK